MRHLAASVLLLAAAMLVTGLWSSKVAAQMDPPVPAPSSLIVKLVSGLTIDQQTTVIVRNGGVETSTVPALRLHIIEVGADQLDQALARYQADSQVARVEVNNVRQSNTAPSDPLYPQQWALPRIGWDAAFATTNPNANVVVAVLDTGIEASHPDLFGNVIAGHSILDESNGMSDPSGHGTMVAGTVAARTNTSPAEGIAGVAYAGVRLMPVTVLNADGLGQDGDIINGVIWAVDHGADLILMAFSNPGFSASLQEALDYAWSSNVVLVAANGNDGVNAPTFPAGDRGVIGVSATDENDQLASFSNYGTSVFLAAPGTNILTTDLGGTYIAINGTSSAAAIVAGAAAQMMAIDPTLTNGVVVGRLARAADPAGTQDETGNGRINLARALLDTGIDYVQPAGAAPIGDGGPFVGPYRASNSRGLTITFNGTGGGSVEIKATKSAGDTVTLGACPGTGSGTATATISASCSTITVTTPSGNPEYQLKATPNQNSVFGGWTSTGGLSGPPAACTGTNNPCGGTNVNANATAIVIFNPAPASKLAITSVNGGVNPTFGTPFAVVVQSQNGSGGATNVIANTPVTLSVKTGTGTLGGTVSGIIAAGTNSITINGATYSKAENGVVLTASRTAGDTLTAGDSASFNVAKAGQTITVTQHAPTNATFGTSFTVKATASSGLTVSVAGTGACSGSGTDTGTGVSLAMNSGTGACAVTYSQAGDANYNAVTPNVVESTTAQMASQTITFGALPDRTFGNADFSVSATASSSLPVSFAAAGNCTVGSSAVHITGAGSCTITASQAGNSNYSAAANVPQNFNIAKATSTTTVTCPVSVTYTTLAQTPCSATVTGAGGLSLTPAPTYSNNINAGTATASYTFVGDADHSGSTQSTNFAIDKANAATSVSSSLNPATADDALSFTATITSGATGTVQFVVEGTSYGSPVTVAANGTATIAFTNKTAGTYSVSANYSGDANFDESTGSLAGGQVITAGAPAQLMFGVQPTNTEAGQPITPAVTVRILDGAGNQTTSSASVTVAASGPGAFTAASTITTAAVAGVATFDTLHLNVAGSYVVGAAGTGLTSAASDTFDVTPGPATTYSFDLPGSVTAGESFTFTLTAKDQFANTATGYMGVVHFTSTDPQATLPADSQFETGDQGVKTLSLATVLRTAGNQTISAKDTVAVTPTITGTSPTITVSPGNATLLLVSAPAAAVAGEAFDVTVEARDGFGNTATGYVGTIRFDITDPKADPVANYPFVSSDQGVHTFSVTLRKAGQWTVSTIDTVTSTITGTSGSIAVQPGPPAKLAFQTQPDDTVVGVAIPDFGVAVEDADDNVVDSSGATIAIAIGNNPRGAVLTGTTVNAINGVATFSGLELDKAAQGYTLVASSDTLTAATSEPFDVGKGTASLTLGGLAQTFDGSPKSASVTTTPSGLTGVSVTYNGSSTGPTNAGSYAVVASLLNDDYAAPDAAGTLVIAKASSTTTVTFEGGPYTYRGMPFTATAAVTGPGGLNSPVPVVYTGDCTNVTASGCTATATFAGDANHDGSSDTKSIAITKASSTTTVTFESGPYVYRATPFTATATVSGVGGLNNPVPVVYIGDCTNVTNANGCTATATFGGDQNHNGSSDTKSITITKASSTTTVIFESGPYVYRATPFTATATVSGVGGLNSPVPVVYTGDCTSVTNANGCTATATFGGDQNHNGSSDTKSITITKASSTTMVTFESGPYVYRAMAYTATATVTGIGGLNSPIVAAYSGDCTNVTVANGCTATAAYGGDQNHNGSGDSKSITIAKASSTTVVTFESGPYTYRATAFAATAAVTGIGALNSSVAVVYTGDCTNVTGTNGCTATATFGGDQNHNGSSDYKSITIAKAGSTTAVMFENGPYAYRATAFTATAAVTGIGGLNSSVNVVYTGDCTNVTGANGCTATATFGGDQNHDGSTDSKSITITKAGSTTVVTFENGPYTYRAAAFTATATVTGVGGLNASVTVMYSGDCTNVSAANGCAGTATYAGDTNHNGSNDTKSITITKAGSATVVTFENGPYVYRATAFAATAVVTGVGGLTNPVTVIYGGDCTNVTVANGCTGTATFAGDTNHDGSSDSKSITITKASSATVLTCPPSVTYSGVAQTPCTASVSGVGGLSQSLTVTYANNLNAGIASASASYPGGANHSGSSDSRTFTINKAATSATLTSAPNPINVGQSVTFTATVSPGAAPGTVTFKEGANTLGTGTIASGVATFSTAALAARPHTVTAEYAETANYFGSASNSVTENINGPPSNVSVNLSAYTIVENDTVALSGSFFDPYDYVIGNHTITINWGDGSANSVLSVPGGAGTFSIPAGVTHQYLDDNPTNTASDNYTITVMVTDSGGLSALATRQIAVNNAPPVIASVTGPNDPIALGGAATVTVNFTDAGSQDAHICTFHWNDGSPDTIVNVAVPGNGACSATRVYTVSNVYQVDVTVTDDDLGTATSYFRYVVVYDASNGFVTGGGWINSPSGAYVANPALVGKANFGFVSKYQKGANIPTGNTEFQFQAAGFNFKSTAYEWLVIAGGKAQYKGTGTINGGGSYGFMLTGIDGKANGGGVDKFRLKVWDGSTIIYDNQTGASDTADPTTALGGGSITVHK